MVHPNSLDCTTHTCSFSAYLNHPASYSSSFIKAPQLGQYFFLMRPLLLPHKEHEYTLYSIRRFLLLMLSHISGIHLPYLTSATLAAGILSMQYMVSSLLNNFGLSIQTAQERILTLATVLSMYSFIPLPSDSTFLRLFPRYNNYH